MLWLRRLLLLPRLLLLLLLLLLQRQRRRRRRRRRRWCWLRCLRRHRGRHTPIGWRLSLMLPEQCFLLLTHELYLMKLLHLLYLLQMLQLLQLMQLLLLEVLQGVPLRKWILLLLLLMDLAVDAFHLLRLL